jgi:hypothetical protein
MMRAFHADLWKIKLRLDQSVDVSSGVLTVN